MRFSQTSQNRIAYPRRLQAITAVLEDVRRVLDVLSQDGPHVLPDESSHSLVVLPLARVRCLDVVLCTLLDGGVERLDLRVIHFDNDMSTRGQLRCILERLRGRIDENHLDTRTCSRQ